jgi:tetratricopeptide (TPR) repeat protein
MANEQDDLAKLSSLNKQFAALFQAGKFNEAIPIAQEFLELSENALDPHHPDTSQALNNLAALYASLGDYAKAEPLFERALKIREKALGTDHPATAQSLNNLAKLYRSMGDFERALKIKEKALGTDHPLTGDYPEAVGSVMADKESDVAKFFSLSQQVSELYQAGRFNEAIPIAQEVLEHSEKALGPAHPGTPWPLTIWRCCIVQWMTPDVMAKEILRRDRSIHIDIGGEVIDNDMLLDGVIDSAAFANTGAGDMSRAAAMNKLGCNWRPAEKPQGSRIAGIFAIHTRLALRREGSPGLKVFSTCQNLIRTLPAMVYGRTNPEDMDGSCEQHATDALRYGLTRKKTFFMEMKVFGI